MRICLCDDEPQMLKYISGKVAELMPNARIREFADGKSLLAGWQEENCDVLLLDIDLPDISGLEVAARMEDMDNKPLLVFVTGHDELVYDSLLFHPFGFIRKNFLDEELGKVLFDCEKELSRREQFFVFKSNNENIRLGTAQILYLESDGNYLKLFTEDKEYRFRDTISVVNEQLRDKGFIRFHRGFLVNQEAVKVLGTDEVQLVNGARIPIGRSYAEAAKKQWMRYMLK